jgi:hypothetical protein
LRTACGYYVFYMSYLLHTGKMSIFDYPKITPWVTSFVSLTCCTNIVGSGKFTSLAGCLRKALTEICFMSGLIITRIYLNERMMNDIDSARSSDTIKHKVMVMVIESAVLYVAVMLCALVLYQIESPAVFFITDIVCLFNHFLLMFSLQLDGIVSCSYWDYVHCHYRTDLSWWTRYGPGDKQIDYFIKTSRDHWRQQ